jgi:hypothetical protein
MTESPPRRPRLLVVAGALATVSLGAPPPVGAGQSVRVLGVVAAAMLWAATRLGSVRLRRAALMLGVAALPLGLTGGVTAGRICYAVALALAAVAGTPPQPPPPDPSRQALRQHPSRQLGMKSA